MVRKSSTHAKCVFVRRVAAKFPAQRKFAVGSLELVPDTGEFGWQIIFRCERESKQGLSCAGPAASAVGECLAAKGE